MINKVLKKFFFFLTITASLLGCCAVKTQLSTPSESHKHIQEYIVYDCVSISAVGDIMVHSPQLKAAWDKDRNQYDFTEVFLPVKDLLSATDLTIANLETTLPGAQELFSGYPQFGSPDAIAYAMQKVGVDIVTTANNHACDKGRLGLNRTIEVLEALGIIPLGTFRDKQDYIKRRVTLIERNNITIAFLSYTYGVNNMPIPEGAIVNLIERKKWQRILCWPGGKIPTLLLF